MILKEKGVEFDSIDYFIDPISRAKLQDLARKIGGSPRDLVRTKEPEYRELDLDRAGVTDDELLDALAANPKLVQRPIVEVGDRAIIARPAERVNEIL